MDFITLPRQKKAELIHYLTVVKDDFLETYPDDLVVYGGDLNRFDIEHLSSICGLKVMVDFPTRGYASFNNCLSNKGTCFASVMLLIC